MPTNVIMPQMGESIAEGTVTKWLKKVGDHVERDERALAHVIAAHLERDSIKARLSKAKREARPKPRIGEGGRNGFPAPR